MTTKPPLGMSGDDMTQGNADDYTLTVTSLGVSASPDCDVNISFNDAMTSFGVCSVGFSFPVGAGGSPNHGVITSATAYFNDASETWFFNTSPVQLQSFTIE